MAITTLNEKQEKLLLCWYILFSVLVLIVLLQTLFGRFENSLLTPWLWLALVGFVPFGVLLIANSINPNPRKIILESAWRMIVFYSIFYLLLLLLTVLGEPFALQNSEMTLNGYLHRSYYWIVPFEVVLLALYAILYFKKEAIFLPTNAALIDKFSKKLSPGSSKEQLANTLRNGDIVGAISFLQQTIGQNESANQDLIQLSAQLRRTQEQAQEGTISHDDAEVTYNKITRTLLLLGNELA